MAKTVKDKKTKTSKPAKDKTKAKKSSGSTPEDCIAVVDSKDLIKAIDNVLAIVPATPQSAYRLTVGKNICLSSIKDDTYCRVIVPGEACEKVQIYLLDDSLTQIKALIRNRGKITINFEAGIMHFKAGSYRATFKVAGSDDSSGVSSNAVSAFDKYDGVKFSDKDMLSMKDGFFSTVNAAVAATRIVCSFFDEYVSTALIEYKKNVLTVLTFDAWHIHHFTAKIKSSTPDMRINIPTAIFGTLEKLIKGGDTNMYVSNEMFAVKTDDLFIILPPMQELEAQAYIDFFDNLPKPICKFDGDTSFGAALDNISGLIKQDGNKRLQFEVQEKGGKLSYSNASGSLSDRFKIRGFKGKPVSMGLDYAIFADTYKAIKSADSFVFGVHPNEEGVPSIYSMRGDMLGGQISIVGYASE